MNRLLLLFFLFIAGTGETYGQFSKNDSWGIFLHYIPDSAKYTLPVNFDAEIWNHWVTNFDVPLLCKQIKSTGANYVFITVGHAAGYFCAPNKTLDSILQRNPGRCSQRDLISDLADGLKRYDIKLGVYITSRAPDGDSLAVEKLKWKEGNHRNKEFQEMWEKVIQEWSIRWGKKVFAWWIDGAYYIDSMYLQKDFPNQYSFAKSLKAGNPEVELCFNPGTRTQLKPHLEVETYSAGEMDYFLNTAGLRPLDGKWFNTPQMMKGKRTFFLTFTGQWWGWGKPRFPDELIIGYTKHIIESGGLMTWDVPIQKTGLIPVENLKQIRKIKRFSRN